ncbi:MAG: hypothetical protein RMM29_08185 [Planctomycetota bacterium]|nr:hypothetical protein [Planctomycetota bacterium]MDW8373605.1 hypothetical protein [Planctomycetota bacterium]
MIPHPSSAENLHRELSQLERLARRALATPESAPEAVPWLGILLVHGRARELSVDCAAFDAALEAVGDALEQLADFGGVDLAIAIERGQGLALYAGQRGVSEAQQRRLDELAHDAEQCPLDADAAAHLEAFRDRYALAEAPGLWPCVRWPLPAEVLAEAERLRIERRLRLAPALAALSESEALAHAADAGEASPFFCARYNSQPVMVELAQGLSLEVQRSLRPNWTLAITVRGAPVLRARAGWRPLRADAQDPETWRLPLAALPPEQRVQALRQPLVIDGVAARCGRWRLVAE